MDSKTALALLIIVVLVLYIVNPTFVSSVVRSKTPNQIEKFSEDNKKGAKYFDLTGLDGLIEFENPVKVPAWGGAQDKSIGLGSNMCSKSCCSQTYPPPFVVPKDPLVCASGDKFVPTSYSCNNGWQDSGCLCMTEEQAMFLSKRGNNIP